MEPPFQEEGEDKELSISLGERPCCQCFPPSQFYKADVCPDSINSCSLVTCSLGICLLAGHSTHWVPQQDQCAHCTLAPLTSSCNVATRHPLSRTCHIPFPPRLADSHANSAGMLAAARCRVWESIYNLYFPQIHFLESLLQRNDNKS